MKPFNVQEAADGKPVVTREGLLARIICFNALSGGYPSDDTRDTAFIYLKKEDAIKNVDNSGDLIAMAIQIEWVE